MTAMMDAASVSNELRSFLVREFLDGQGEDLDASTPLLESGIIDSMSILALTRFVEQRFGVRIPVENLVPDTFQNLEVLSKFVVRLSA